MRQPHSEYRSLKYQISHTQMITASTPAAKPMADHNVPELYHGSAVAMALI